MKKYVLAVLAFVGSGLVAACGDNRSDYEKQQEKIWSDYHNAQTQAVENAISRDMDANQNDTSKASRRDQLRKKARRDPDGADRDAISEMSREELLATSINSAGYLCARVTDMYPSGDAIIVHCVEYRSGSGRVKYSVNAQAGTVEPL